MSASEVVELSLRGPAIAELTRAGALKIMLDGATAHTRVHVIATRFVPAPADPSPRTDRPKRSRRDAERGVTYVSGRELGDEYRYVLDRRTARRYPGVTSRQAEPVAQPVGAARDHHRDRRGTRWTRLRSADGRDGTARRLRRSGTRRWWWRGSERRRVRRLRFSRRAADRFRESRPERWRGHDRIGRPRPRDRGQRDRRRSSGFGAAHDVARRDAARRARSSSARRARSGSPRDAEEDDRAVASGRRTRDLAISRPRRSI